MIKPKRIEELTIEDLQNHRWCYFHNDQDGFDAFEHVVPDTHPQFDETVIELELAIFRFNCGKERFGMFDGSKGFTVFLDGEWLSLWFGIAEPSTHEITRFAEVVSRLGLAMPVRAVAKWSGTSEIFGGLRYCDSNRNEIEVHV